MKDNTYFENISTGILTIICRLGPQGLCQHQEAKSNVSINQVNLRQRKWDFSFKLLDKMYES